jgi:hypothetical protein
MAASVAGIGFDELVWRILETSMSSQSDLGEPPEVAGGG